MGQIQCAKISLCLPWNHIFLKILTIGTIVPQSLLLSPEPKPFFHSQKPFEQKTEMTFDRRLANITGLVVRDSYCHHWSGSSVFIYTWASNCLNQRKCDELSCLPFNCQIYHWTNPMRNLHSNFCNIRGYHEEGEAWHWVCWKLCGGQYTWKAEAV